MAQIWRAALLGTLAISFCGTAASAYASPVPMPASYSTSDMQLKIEILSATHGVDLKDYLAKVKASLTRNWFAIMPESALLGRKGVVTLVFHIQQDGTLLNDDPKFESVSGTEAFDKAAADSIRNAARFERLPADFPSKNIKLKIVFYYNLPIDSKKRKARQTKAQTMTKFTPWDQHLPV